MTDELVVTAARAGWQLMPLGNGCEARFQADDDIEITIEVVADVDGFAFTRSSRGASRVVCHSPDLGVVHQAMTDYLTG